MINPFIKLRGVVSDFYADVNHIGIVEKQFSELKGGRVFRARVNFKNGSLDEYYVTEETPEEILALIQNYYGDCLLQFKKSQRF